VCVWWHDFDCSQARGLYDQNAKLYQLPSSYSSYSTTTTKAPPVTKLKKYINRALEPTDSKEKQEPEGREFPSVLDVNRNLLIETNDYLASLKEMMTSNESSLKNEVISSTDSNEEATDVPLSVNLSEEATTFNPISLSSVS